MGDEEAIECGAVVGEFGEEGFLGGVVVGDFPVAVGMLPCEEAVGAEAEAVAKLGVAGFEEEDVAEVEQGVVGEGDGFNVVAPLLGEAL